MRFFVAALFIFSMLFADAFAAQQQRHHARARLLMKIHKGTCSIDQRCRFKVGGAARSVYCDSGHPCRGVGHACNYSYKSIRAIRS